MPSLLIDPGRVMADLRTLAEFGRFETGVNRPSLSAEDIAARNWFAGRMAEAGLAAEIDGIGNVIGRDGHEGPKLLAGSHLESVAYGGWLDGALGCVYALEAARILAATERPKRLGLDVAAFFDEEGHFGSFLGSRSFIGQLDETEIDRTANKRDGTSLRAALAAAGWAGRRRVVIREGEYVGFLEAHIEQGGILERGGVSVGVVTSIVGIRQYRLVVLGEQNHAGTTPMSVRRDAGAALVRLLARIETCFLEHGSPGTVWTVGRIELHPGAQSIVPGRAEALLQIRDASCETLDTMHAALGETIAVENASAPCEIRLELLNASSPTPMDKGLRALLSDAAQRQCGDGYYHLVSGATHDARILAQAMPAAMLFVPSIGGISHDIREDTSERDIIAGANVFTAAALRICCP